MRFLSVLITVAVALFLAGCDSSTSANKSNFAKAINAKFSAGCIVLKPGKNSLAALSSNQYPVGVKEEKLGAGYDKADVDKMNAAAFGPFDALVKAGMLTATPGKVKPIGGYETTGKIYSLTPAGEKALESKDGLSFCAGHWHVKEVTSFSPTDKGPDGSTFSKVQFSYVASDLPTWVSAAADAGYPNLKQSIGSTSNDQADLVQKSNGWEARFNKIAPL